MQPGDELYYFVRARDNAPRRRPPEPVATHILRLPGALEEGVEGAGLPTLVKPKTVSQRQIILDTEQLVCDSEGLGRDGRPNAPAQRRNCQ